MAILQKNGRDIERLTYSFVIFFLVVVTVSLMDDWQERLCLSI